MLLKSSVVRVILVVCVVSVAVLSPMFVYNAMNFQEEPVIVVDAGHGGVDGGVVGSDGTKESDINLEIARRLKGKLEEDGYKVIMTRNHKGAIASSKKGDMARRKEIIKEAHACAVVSIHINKFSDTRRQGAQVFYDDTNKWRNYGIVMQRVLNEYINKKYAGRAFEAIGGDYFMTKCHDVPSIIVECGFISNEAELERLKSTSYQELLARVIASGVSTMLEYNN